MFKCRVVRHSVILSLYYIKNVLLTFVLFYSNIFLSGDHLREKYSGATRVKPTRQGRLRLHRRKAKIPTANDLVFIKESPDYCHHNSTTGSLGEKSSLEIP